MRTYCSCIAECSSLCLTNKTRSAYLALGLCFGIVSLLCVVSVCVKLIWRATSSSSSGGHITISAVDVTESDAAAADGGAALASSGSMGDADMTGGNGNAAQDGNHSNSNSNEDSEHDQRETDRSDEDSQSPRIPGTEAFACANNLSYVHTYMRPS